MRAEPIGFQNQLLNHSDTVPRWFEQKGCSMRGSNPRLLAHKTNTLPAELMEQISDYKKDDSDEIRTRAGEAQQISNLPP